MTDTVYILCSSYRACSYCIESSNIRSLWCTICDINCYMFRHRGAILKDSVSYALIICSCWLALIKGRVVGGSVNCAVMESYGFLTQTLLMGTRVPRCWPFKAQRSLYVQYRTVVTIYTAQRSPYVPHNGHNMYRTAVTICTAQWSLYISHSGHHMYRRTVTICTAQRSPYVPHGGHYMYHQFNIQQFHVLPTQCIYVICVDLRTNSHYFPIQH